VVEALGAPHLGERTEKELISAFGKCQLSFLDHRITSDIPSLHAACRLLLTVGFLGEFACPPCQKVEALCYREHHYTEAPSCISAA
jgi:hypothetical protein